jgi:AraC-like DNA-binding protein
MEPGGERHTNRIGSRGAHVLSVQVDATRRDLFAPCAGFLEGVHHFEDAGIGALARRLAAELGRDEALSGLFVEALALEMLATAARLDAGTGRARAAPAWLARARDLLHDRFAAPPRPSEVAREAGVHPMHLARAFRAHYGASMGEFVRRRRLEWAMERLARSDDPIATIALQAGFADQSHLTRLLRRHTGVTPRRYRDAVRG